MLDFPLPALTQWDSIAVFSVAFFTCLLIVASRTKHLKYTSRAADLSSIQTAHSRQTPRIGGVAVLLAFGLATLLEPSLSAYHKIVFLISLFPVFLGGLLEDVGFDVGPIYRLGAAVVSGIVAIALLDLWIDRIDLPFVDAVLGIAACGMAFTLLCSSGFSHAFNLIDGLNGLAGGTAILIALGLSWIAAQSGLDGLSTISFLLAPALLGFLLLNWPFGWLFLGDAGAYTLGHVFAWIAILIAASAPETAAFALALVLFWPTTDTVHAILRRRQAKKSAFFPDRLHFHQLVMRTLEIAWLGRDRRHVANPLAAAVLMPFIAAPVLAGALTWNQPLLACLLFFVFVGLFVLSYNRLAMFARTSARSHRRSAPVAREVSPLSRG